MAARPYVDQPVHLHGMSVEVDARRWREDLARPDVELALVKRALDHVARQEPHLEVLVLVGAQAIGAVEAVLGLVDGVSAAVVVPANEILSVDIVAGTGADPFGHGETSYRVKTGRTSSASSNFSCSCGSIETEAAVSG